MGNALRYLGAALILAEGAIHLQQLVDFIHAIPHIGPLFALNAAGALVVAGALAARRGVAAPIAGIALSLGALIGIALARGDGLLGYMEPVLRPSVVLAVGVEIAAVAVLAGYLLVHLRGRRADPPALRRPRLGR
ncbi:MAG: hypothetical protein M3N16_03820 [Actinomycetota bacterium]|nr:hypothetical protein [Actinomycetota bacterium]